MQKIMKVLSLIFTITLASCLLCACGDSSDVSSEESTEWTFYTAYGSCDRTCCKVWEELFDEVERETDGRLKIHILWYGEHPYEDTQLLKQLKEGSCQIAHFCSSYARDLEPALAVDQLPLVFPDDSEKTYQILTALWGGFEGDASGILESILQKNWNATMVHCVPTVSETLITDGYEAIIPSSLSSHKIRTYDATSSDFVKALGGTPVELPLGETMDNLSKSTVDGLISTGSLADGINVFSLADTINQWGIASQYDYIMVNWDALNALPADVKEIFLRVMHESASNPETSDLDENNTLLEDLQKEGVKVVSPSPEYREAVRAALAKGAWATWKAKTGDNGQRILDKIDELSNTN